MSREAIVLQAEKRDVIGKKVKSLRAQGSIPAVVYGPKQEPVHLSVNWQELRPTLLEAGGTQLVELNADKDKYTVLVRDVDRHPVYHDRVLHVDFYAVDLTSTIITSVPLVLENEAETQIRINGRIVLDISSIEVESLPTDIPSQIVIDVSGLMEVGDVITLAALPQIEGVSYIDEPDTLVVRTDHFGIMPAEDEEEEGEEGLEEEITEPELITRQKDDDFEDEE